MDDVRVLRFHGEMDIFSRTWIEQELQQIEGLAHGSIAILDLTGVRYLDTTFLDALMRVRNRLAKAKMGVRICLVTPRSGIARRLFEITKLDAIFPLFEDMQAAKLLAA